MRSGVRSGNGPDLPTPASIAVAAVTRAAGGGEVIGRGDGTGGLMMTLPGPADASTAVAGATQQAAAIVAVEPQHERACAAGWLTGVEWP